MHQDCVSCEAPYVHISILGDVFGQGIACASALTGTFRVRVRVRVKLLRLFRVNNYGWRAAMEQLANLI